MTIEVYKYNNSLKTQEVEFLKIENYKILIQNSSLLLVRDGQMEITSKPEKKDAPFLEIYKVQFITACETKFENEIIVAFYLGEGSEMKGHVLAGLPENYQSSNEPFYLVDYKSYLDICDLTEENKLSFGEFYSEVKSGSLGVNTLLTYNGQNLNYNNQKELWRQLDEVKN